MTEHIAEQKAGAGTGALSPNQREDAEKKAAKKAEKTITIKPPNFGILHVRIEGTAPYMQCRFSEKVAKGMKEKMEAGSTAAKGKKAREARDFNADFKGAQHVSAEGWCGIPASSFRNASISACKTVGFAMTRAKLSIFIEADGIDVVDASPLVKIDGPDPECSILPTRNATGVVDLRARPLWRKWAATVRVRYDADQFTASDVVNLMARAGMQVGIGEGRPDSKQSNGLGFGLFKVTDVKTPA